MRGRWLGVLAIAIGATGCSGCFSGCQIAPINLFGCDSSCEGNVPHGAKTCFFGGSCGATCDDGFGDCDKDVSNGCESPLSNDPSNCGYCGLTCSSGTCSSSKCVGGTGDAAPPNGVITLATGLSQPAVLVSDGTKVYWIDGSTLSSVPREGGASTVLIPNAGFVGGIAASAGYVYTTTVDGIVRISGQNGAVDTIASVPLIVSGLAADPGSIYFRAFEDGGVALNRVAPVPEAGVETLGPLSASAGTIVHPLAAGYGGALAVTSDGVAFAPTDAGTGSAFNSLVGSASSVTAVTGTNSHAFFGTSDSFSSSLYAIDQDASSPLLATLIDVASDGQYLYTAESNGDGTGFIEVFDSTALYTGGTDLTGTFGTPVAIAVDDTYVYWMTAGPIGELYRISK